MPSKMCFVLVPFGKVLDPNGGPDIDFEKIYQQAIEPAIRKAGLEPLRADEARSGGTMHKAMFERLMLCEFALADLTAAHPNVYYELGIRHAARPNTTITLYAARQRIPLDTIALQSLQYELGPKNAFGIAQAELLSNQLTQRFKELSQGQKQIDSPVFKLLDHYKAPELPHTRTDIFRDRVQYAENIKNHLVIARKNKDAQAIRQLQDQLIDLAETDAAILMDLMLSYRAVEDYASAVDLVNHMSKPLQRTIMVREQLAFSLNRMGASVRAMDILEHLESEVGSNPETCGLLGRVYKDCWAKAVANGKTNEAQEWMDKTIATYMRGFRADSRDPYPGINALTFLEVKGDPQSQQQQQKLLPVVRFAIERRFHSGDPDYWDHATMIELAALENDPELAEDHAAECLLLMREPWEGKSTANNLKILAKARKSRGQDVTWLEDLIAPLESDNSLFPRT